MTKKEVLAMLGLAQWRLDYAQGRGKITLTPRVYKWKHNAYTWEDVRAIAAYFDLSAPQEATDMPK